ncbi:MULTISPECIES: hypothetical protein [Chelatococcus]|uniref:Uncharacterized protein n=1 Tax=Chelatococcus caeni TaxID=1348468 RepID=A0A840C448_9HYPH|nr:MULTISPECIES: hypothetical protein [Chelatococcus]MBB4018388.1 hypothetical protein [Chelatococcus caeni]
MRLHKFQAIVADPVAKLYAISTLIAGNLGFPPPLFPLEGETPCG